MPLRDHFRPPLDNKRHWEGFHATWPVMIVAADIKPHRDVGSWLNRVELFFGVLSRKLLKRGDFAGAEQFEKRVRQWLGRHNTGQAFPYRRTYTGEPLVRATPFSQTSRQRRRGRAWFGSRRQLFGRLFHPPRPYRRRRKPLAANS